jgi:hypothetical protein
MKVKQVAHFILGATMIVAGAWLLWRLFRSIWLQFVVLPPQVAVGLLTAAATVLAATGTIVLGRAYDRKREIESHFRARKVEIYDEFLKELFRVLHSGGSEASGLADFLREWQRKMIVWGGSSVLVRYMAWMKHLQTVAPDAETFFKMVICF